MRTAQPLLLYRYVSGKTVGLAAPPSPYGVLRKDLDALFFEIKWDRRRWANTVTLTVRNTPTRTRFFGHTLVMATHCPHRVGP